MRKNTQAGFTLIELVASMVILSIVFAVAAKKMGSLETEAQYVALDSGISEMNTREMLAWCKSRLDNNYTNDSDLFVQVSKDLGSKYAWASITQDGGVLRYGKASAILTRKRSSMDGAGRWQ